MLTFTASDAKNNFGTLTDTALTQPVSITRRGRVILEMMTPQAKEALIQERIKELVFAQFIGDAIEADKEYTETGLHTNFSEMQTWANSLGTDHPLVMPTCHK